MANILNALLGITLFSAIIFAAILIFQRLLRRRISAALNYAVWALLLLRLLVPVTLESGWHLFTVPQAGQTAQTQDAPDSDIVEIPAISSAVMPISDENADPLKPQYQVSPSSNQNPKAVPAKPVDWQTVAVLVWATGALVFLTYTAIQWLRLSRRIKPGSMHIPDSVHVMFNTQKRALHIRRRIGISVQDWLTSPALSASFCPVLLLPAAMLPDKEAVVFGIRHELTHYKRKDHLLSLLLLVLRCVYWFNPVVWLAFRCIQTDMETACDAAVTARMAHHERTRYIHTMIDMGRDAKPLYALGMSAGNGRLTLEKRVRGIFMTKRTGLTARMAAVLLALLLLFTCFTTACQPTPETPVVVNKNEGVLEAAIAATPAPAAGYEAPKRLEMEPFMVGDKLTVNVDAAVDIPNIDTFPVYEFVPALFSQEQIDGLVDYFYKDQPLYNSGTGWTKSIFEQKIVELKKIKQEILNGATNEVGNAKYEMSAEDVQQSIDMMVQDMQDAPETVDTSVWDGQITSRNKGDVVYLGFNVTPDLTEKKTRFFLASKYEKLNSSALMLVDGFRYYPTYDRPPDTQAEGLQITPAQAVALTRDMLEACGFDFMEPVGAYAGEIGDSDEAGDNTSGYAVKCIRRAGDFFVTSATNGVTQDARRSDLTSEEQQAAYAYQWDPEILTVSVDDTGITAVEWEGYGEMGVTRSENVPLLPFDKLPMYIENGITTCYAWNETDQEGINKREINITGIKLSMGRVQVKDHPDNWQLVPVFEIYGTLSISYNDQQETRSYEGMESGFHGLSLLTINAIDGSAVMSY